jgi:hypothetical protein
MPICEIKIFILFFIYLEKLVMHHCTHWYTPMGTMMPVEVGIYTTQHTNGYNDACWVRYLHHPTHQWVQWCLLSSVSTPPNTPMGTMMPVEVGIYTTQHTNGYNDACWGRCIIFCFYFCIFVCLFCVCVCQKDLKIIVWISLDLCKYLVWHRLSESMSRHPYNGSY